MLNNGGHEVVGDGNHSATNFARMVKLQPQIVCIDIGEPDKDGLALLESVREQLPKALIFLVSAKMDAEIIQAAQSRGVVGFIVKPFNAVAVLMSIRNTILRIAKQAKSQTKLAPDNDVAQVQGESPANSDEALNDGGHQPDGQN